jgi:hypothetical protein
MNFFQDLSFIESNKETLCIHILGTRFLLEVE